MAQSTHTWLMTKQFIENQQAASKIKSSLTNKANPILQNDSCCSLRKQRSETSRYYLNIKPIDDMDRKPLRKAGCLSTSTSAVFSANASTVRPTRRKDLRSQHEVKNHKIRINSIKTVESIAREDHLEQNLIPLLSTSPVDRTLRSSKSRESKGLPSEEYKRINRKQILFNSDEKGKKMIADPRASSFNHLFDQKAPEKEAISLKKDYQLERIHKKNINAFKSSIDSLIKYDYGQGHIYPHHDFATKPNNVKYNTLIKHTNKTINTYRSSTKNSTTTNIF